MFLVGSYRLMLSFCGWCGVVICKVIFVYFPTLVEVEFGSLTKKPENTLHADRNLWTKSMCKP